MKFPFFCLDDHSCVKIEGIAAIEGSDYINASYFPVSDFAA